jgi:hypothetical protein
VPRDIAERLAALNEDPADFREMAWQHGADFLPGFIDKLEQRNTLYREWSPRLRAFADMCRADRPLPVEQSLGDCERAKQGVYAEKLSRNRPAPGRDGTVAICSMPLIAMAVAKRLWPQDDGRTVLLTPEEDERWNEMYSHPEDAFQWFAHFWWTIDDSAERECSLPDGRSFARWDENAVPAGESPWLVTVGHCHGPLAGAGYQELWSWDGRRARLITKLGSWIS